MYKQIWLTNMVANCVPPPQECINSNHGQALYTLCTIDMKKSAIHLIKCNDKRVQQRYVNQHQAFIHHLDKLHTQPKLITLFPNSLSPQISIFLYIKRLNLEISLKLSTLPKQKTS